jgi:hypothetical protein
MSAVSLRNQIIQELDRLTHSQQEQLLDIARRLQQSPLPPGTPGNALLAHMDNFEFAPGSVDEMMQAIEEGCERIDWDGWQ